MTGFLVVNHFLQGQKFSALHNHLKTTAEKMGIELAIKTNQQMIFEKQQPDFVLFWDKDVNVASFLESKKIPVFNSSRAIELCDDKAKTYCKLLGKVLQPKTIFAPLTFYDCDYGDFVDKAAKELGYPIVFKNCYGSFGQQVFLCNNKEEVLSHITGVPFLFQEYIECGSRDVRLEIVDGKCVAAMERSNPSDFRSNITNGGSAKEYSPSPQQVELAVKACDLLGLDFGGVDILGGNMVCEVNSNAHIMNIMNVTNIDVAPLIFESILGKI